MNKMTTLSPTTAKERHVVLDALRGLALLGIALANYPEFALWTFLSADEQSAMPTAGIDRTVRFLQYMLVDGKFYTIFSLLFGVGFALILNRHPVTLFPNIDVCERMGIKEHLWDGYQRLRPQIIAIETLIANGFISPELMHDLHGYQFREVYNSLSADAKSAWAYLLTRLQSEVLYQLGGQPPRQQYLADLVNFIRNNIELFQQWAESDTAQLYTPPVFVNKKEAQGYFF